MVSRVLYWLAVLADDQGSVLRREDVVPGEGGADYGRYSTAYIVVGEDNISCQVSVASCLVGLI